MTHLVILFVDCCKKRGGSGWCTGVGAPSWRRLSLPPNLNSTIARQNALFTTVDWYRHVKPLTHTHTTRKYKREDGCEESSFAIMASTRAVVLDINCFFNNYMRYVVKEMSIYDLNHHSSQHWIFKPPQGYTIVNAKAQRTNEWLTRNNHGISWEQGDVSYIELSRILEHIASSYNIVYVKGQQKIDFIQRQIFASPEFVNLECMGCPKLCVLLEPLWLGHHCTHHHFDPKQCTIYKTRAIARWLLSNWK